MRAPGSRYLPTEPARYSRAFPPARYSRAFEPARYLRAGILLTLLAFPLVTAGCGPRQVWGLPTDQLSAALAHGDYSQLSGVDLQARNPDDALGLAPGAPYYLSFVFDSLDRPLDSLSMLETAWSRSPSPWKEEAGVLLAERYNQEKAWDKAAAVARRLVSGRAAPAGADPAASVEQRARRALVEALYWSQDDASVLDEASRLVSPDAEVLLFRAVSSLRLGLATAHDLVMKLFLDERTSALHGRFATYLSGQPGYLPLFSQADQDVINGRNALLQGSLSTALPLLEDALAAPDPSAVAHTALLMDMGNAYAAAGRSAAGAVFMQKLSTRLVGQPRADALEQAGKLFRRARDYADALTLLRAAAEEAPTLDQRDRARWFILDILFALAPADLAARVEAESTHWNDPEYFADVLEDRLSDLVSARKWQTLDALRRALSAHGPDSVQAELDYVLARAWQEGRIRTLAGSSADELFADAARRDPTGYYGIMASSMLGQVPSEVLRGSDRAVAGSTPPGGPAGSPLDPFIMGFLSYGLGGEAYQRLVAVRTSLTDAQVLDAAQRFAAAGDLRDSLYLIGTLARRRKLDTAELELFYPRGYAEILEPLAAAAGIPDHVMYGLVREESYFDAGVVSSAGAVGLSQLMPATALPLAQRLKLTDPDLRNPSTNLAIGVRHFQDLLRNVDNPVKALLAYNAGLSRVRQWERAAANLPPDLLVESVPIAETRQYVRKILVSSVMYAFLYHDADPREAALSFFGIKPSTDYRGGAPVSPKSPANR